MKKHKRVIAALLLTLTLCLSGCQTEGDNWNLETMANTVEETSSSQSSLDDLFLEGIFDEDSPLSPETRAEIERLLQESGDADVYQQILELIERDIDSQLNDEMSEEALALSRLIVEVEHARLAYLVEEELEEDEIGEGSEGEVDDEDDEDEAAKEAQRRQEAYQWCTGAIPELKFLLAVMQDQGANALYLDYYTFSSGGMFLDEDLVQYSTFLDYLYAWDDDDTLEEMMDNGEYDWWTEQEGQDDVDVEEQRYQDENMINYFHFAGFGEVDYEYRLAEGTANANSEDEEEEPDTQTIDYWTASVPPVQFWAEEYEIDAEELWAFYSGRASIRYLLEEPPLELQDAFSHMDLTALLATADSARRDADCVYMCDTVCRVHTTSYHTLTPELVQHVGERRIRYFLRIYTQENANIRNLVSLFGISRADFERMHSGYEIQPYNTEWVYGSNAEAFSLR